MEPSGHPQNSHFWSVIPPPPGLITSLATFLGWIPFLSHLQREQPRCPSLSQPHALSRGSHHCAWTPTHVSNHRFLPNLHVYIANPLLDSSSWLLYSAWELNYSTHTHAHTQSMPAPLLVFHILLNSTTNKPFAKRNRSLFPLFFIFKIQFIIKPYQLNL